jgi:hypothetical protein
LNASISDLFISDLFQPIIKIISLCPTVSAGSDRLRETDRVPRSSVADLPTTEVGQMSGVNEWRDGEEMKALTVGGIRLTPPVPCRALFSRRPGGGDCFGLASKSGQIILNFKGASFEICEPARPS